MNSAFEASAAALFSLGSGAGIVLAFSSWLGKVWARRLMAEEKARHNQELEQLRATLKSQVDRSSRTYMEKIALYKEVSSPVIDLIVKAQHNGSLTSDDLKTFDTSRLATTALLAMFAPTPVFNEYNHVIDYLYDAVESKAVWSFPEFRTRALTLLTLIRADIGLYQDAVHYSGTR